VLEQYYQWKSACILSVNKYDQVAAELKKIDRTWKDDNQERVFSLTSWAIVDEMFPDEMARKPNGSIDWSQNGWDYDNTMDSRGEARLWPTPATFVEDGESCIMCLNPFGPEGGIAVGTCRHMFHPICLIGFMVIRSRCPLCKAPFHKRLYNLFGLEQYMPPHWEYNATNALGH